jgi:hypothetical protein
MAMARWDDENGEPDGENDERCCDFAQHRSLSTEEGCDMQSGGTGMGRS